MKHIFIMNPVAGSGTAEESLLPQIIDFAKTEELDYEIHRTLNKEEVGSYCRQRAEKGAPMRFYACGGDGTIRDVVNGIAGFENAELAVYPCGTGNDFVRNFTEHKNFLDIGKLVRGTPVSIDLIKTDKGYVANMANVGIDSEVVAEVAEMKKGIFKGSFAYLAGLVKVLSNMRSYRMVYEKDGEKKEEEFLLACVGNGSYCGGGFMSCPEALLDDGEMDICLVRPVKGLALMRLLAKYRMGTHLMDKDADRYIIYFRAKHFSLESLDPVRVSFDGELSKFTATEFEISPKALRFVVPEGSELVRKQATPDFPEG